MSSRSTNSLQVLAPLFICILFFSSAHFTHAQGGIAVQVQPSTIDEQANPGDILDGAITITNRNGGKQTYYISTRNVTGMNEVGTPEFSKDPSTNPIEAASWIRPGVESVTLEQDESVQVPYRIEVPEDASPGGHFAAFFVTRQADEAIETGAGVGFHVASLVNLRVSGEVNEDMLLREFYTNKTFFSEPNVVFYTRLDNTGTIHQRPLGIITITDMFGNEVGQVKFNESSGAIIPRHDRIFETTWTHDGFVLGRYTALASVLIGETDKKTLTREVSFWVVPLKELGIAFGILAGLLLIFIVSVRRYVRSMLKKAGHQTLSKQKSHSLSLAQRMLRTMIWLLGILAVLFIGMIVFFA